MRTWAPGVDPFAHEARVHLFRRDRYLSIGRMLLAKPVEKEGREPNAEEVMDARRAFSVAWWENQIVENFFPETLRRSSYQYDDAVLDLLAEQLVADEPYESKVSNMVTHEIGESTFVTGWVLALLGLVVLERWVGRERGGDGEP